MRSKSTQGQSSKQIFRAATARALPKNEKTRIVKAVRRSTRLAVIALPALPRWDEPPTIEELVDQFEILKIRDRILGRVVDVIVGETQQRAIKNRDRRNRIAIEASDMAEKIKQPFSEAYSFLIDQLSDFLD